MGLQKINCENCGIEFECEVQICCTSASADCGCLGLPVNGPLVCSEKCYDELIEKINTFKHGNNPRGTEPLYFDL